MPLQLTNQMSHCLYLHSAAKHLQAYIRRWFRNLRHISKHLLAYAHKCFPTCKSSILAQPASRQELKANSKVSPFWKLVNQGDMAHESMTKQNSYKLYHDDIRNVLKGRSGGLPPRKTVDIPHFLLLDGRGGGEWTLDIPIFACEHASLRLRNAF